MKLRSASLLIAVLATSTACKSKTEGPAPQPVTPITSPGKADPAPISKAADPWAKPNAGKEPLKKPLFWSIEKDGKTSYLLGTMHVGVDPNTRLPEIVWKRLDEAKIFAMETDLSGAAKLDVLRKDGSSLRDELGAVYWKKLEDAIGVQEAGRLIGFKPMVPATLLSLRGLPETAPMDGVLHGRALNQKKKIVFLETLEHEAAILEKWMNARALKDMLDDLAGGQAVTLEMLAAYLAGDEGKILAINDAERIRSKQRGRSDKEYDEQMDDMLYKRNAAWIAPIEKLHAEAGGFIAVGAMHAIGPRSVNELLEKKGYKITRITP